MIQNKEELFMCTNNSLAMEKMHRRIKTKKGTSSRKSKAKSIKEEGRINQ